MTQSTSHDGTYEQVDALRDLLRSVGSSNFTLAHMPDGAWFVVAYCDDGDAPAARAFITPGGRVRADLIGSAA